jgi:hypothetical protein
MHGSAEPDDAPPAARALVREPAWLVLTEECDAATLRAEFLDLMRSDGCDPELTVLVDFRRTRFLPEPAEAIAVAEALAPPTRYLRPHVALVAAEDETLRVLGLIATLSSLRGGSVRSFRSFDAALAWLDDSVATGEPTRPVISSR